MTTRKYIPYILLSAVIGFCFGFGLRVINPIEVDVYPIFEKCWKQKGRVHVRDGEYGNKGVYCLKDVEEKLN